MLKLDVASADARQHSPRREAPLVGGFGQGLKRTHGGQGLPSSRHQKGELADRSERPACEHDHRDDRAHRDFASVEEVEAADDKTDANHLLRQGC